MEHAKTGRPFISIGELLVECIPVEPKLRICEEGAIIKTASGSCGIVACAFARLGGNAAFFGKIGRDGLSDFVYGALKREGVDVSHIVVSDEGQIGLSFVEYLENGRNFQYYRKNSVGSRLSPADIDETFIAGASAIHYAGMLLEVSPEMRAACQECVRIARKHGVPVSFDPNIRKEVMGSDEARGRLLEAIRSADIIAPTLDEARFVTGLDDPHDILRELHAWGPRVIALTCDANGAIVSDGKQIVTAGGIDVPAIDPTGAGDTFAAALVYCVLQGYDLERTALFCNCAGSLAVTKQGSIGRALPSSAEVEALMRRLS